jgi:MFS family permease
MPKSSLLLDADFRRYWVAIVVSVLGDNMSTVAIPWIATVVLRADATQMGLLSASLWAPSLLFAVPAGAWSDRIGHRRICMIASNVISFVALALVTVGDVLGILALWQLYIAIYICGMCLVIYTVCDNMVFVSIVKSQQYVDGQSLIFGGVACSTLVGPAVGGLLMQVLSAPLVILADAVSFLCSALCLACIRGKEALPARVSEPATIIAGFRFICQCDEIRSTLCVAGGVNLFNSLFLSLFVFFLVGELHASSDLIGTLLASGAVGGLIGSTLTKRLVQRIGEGWALLFGSIMISVPLIIVPMTHAVTRLSVLLLFAGLSLSALGRAAQNIVIGSVFAAVVPNSLRSRTRGAFQTVSLGARFLGSVLGGALGTTIDVRSTLWIGAVGGTLSFVWLLPSSLLRSRLTITRSGPDALIEGA